MAKWRVIVAETVCATYDECVVEAETEQDAVAVAKKLRIEGKLGCPNVAVEGVDYDAWLED